MPRVRSKIVRKRKHKKWLKRAKGFWGRRKNLYSVARVASIKALSYATRDRKVRKRMFRRLWITRVHAACNKNEISYSVFINNLKKAGINLNRKILADIAVFDAEAFSLLVKSTTR
ncbi:MAG: 50S ribosomal protein L20 [Candidatus Cloacimonadota bacterium]|jgi:large subunit ribosomal protein L20|nr:MAG: 50S ribosomal protein L20 [Candidatus Cloacimonadota bacterium]